MGNRISGGMCPVSEIISKGLHTIKLYEDTRHKRWLQKIKDAIAVVLKRKNRFAKLLHKIGIKKPYEKVLIGRGWVLMLDTVVDKEPNDPRLLENDIKEWVDRTLSRDHGTWFNWTQMHGRKWTDRISEIVEMAKTYPVGGEMYITVDDYQMLIGN